MKNILKRISTIVMVLILSVGMYPFIVNAATSATVTISDVSATLGDEVSVRVNVSCSSTIASTELYLKYDPNILELKPDNSNVFGGGGNIRILSTESTSFTIKFNTVKAGESNISFTKGLIIEQIYERSEIEINAGTGSVTVNAPANYSSNNNLSSLSISPGTLTPAFSPDIISYTATVGADCASLVVSAPTQDSTARVSVTGKKMDPGMNTTTITVTAENGSVKTYVIKTTKDTSVTTTPTTANTNNAVAATTANTQETQASPSVTDISVTVNGATYHIISDFSKHPLPDGYTATDMDYNGQKITVGKGVNGLTIVYLEKADGSNEGGFYVYDTASKSFSPLCTVAQPELSYTILPITSSMEMPDHYTKSSLTINGNTVDVLIPEGANAKYCLFYGVDANGKAGWYRYDYEDQTVQKYYGEDLSANTKADNTQSSDSSKRWKIIAASSASVSFILLVAVIVLAAKMRAKKTMSYYGDNDEEDIFSIIEHREMADKESKENENEESRNDVSDDRLDSNKLDSDESEEQAYDSEIASEIVPEITSEAAATQEIDFDDDEFELEPEELEEHDETQPVTKDLSDDEDDNDISDLKDILADDEDKNDQNQSGEDKSESDYLDEEDDFEFLDINYLEEPEDK